MGGSAPAKRRHSLTTLWWARHPEHVARNALVRKSLGFCSMCRREPGLCPSHLPSSAADEPTSPSIDLQARHVPASAVVSSAMNSAPVLGTSPSSPTFTFALSRHYSQDCSECLWPVSPPPPLSGPCGSFAQCLLLSGAPWESPLLTRREGS